MREHLAGADVGIRDDAIVLFLPLRILRLVRIPRLADASPPVARSVVDSLNNSIRDVAAEVLLVTDAQEVEAVDEAVEE
jgi:hypothetical protein